MKNILNTILLAGFLMTLMACKKELPTIDKVYGTYNGFLKAGTSSIGCYTVVTMTNDTLVHFGIGETNQPVSMLLDSVVISINESEYELTKYSMHLGTVDGTDLHWSDGFYDFTGKK